MKKLGILMMSAFVLAGCSTEDYEASIHSLEEEVALLETENQELTEENKAVLENQKDVQAAYDEYKERMKPYEELEEAEAEARQLEAERIAEEERQEKQAQKEEEEKEEEARKEAEEQEAQEKEAQGYATGITYDQLARTPDDYMGEKVTFNGKVVQVMEGSDEVQLRLAVNDDYDTIILLAYDSSIVEQRVLEDDYLTVYGISMGTVTYESTLGGEITIPSALVDRIDFN